ncbi:MAG: N-formylglutamate amidohydrolase [Planctomycetaceae bacterium]|nr:N-formylglutamate amidohydrolase [Planctomycetaceae bacterium]
MAHTPLPIHVVVTCEHGGNGIPAEYAALFAHAEAELASHRGYDPGTLELAKRLAKALGAPVFSTTVSRLLIELNRSPDHPRLFSEFTRRLNRESKERLIDEHYRPYRDKVQEAIAERCGSGRCLHVSVHSFTPIWKGKPRTTDLGLLFDPSRIWEAAICEDWRKRLRRETPGRRIHFNLPYRGTSDGFTTHLRRFFPDNCYAGIEIEVNQRFPLNGDELWEAVQSEIVETAITLMRSRSI